MNRNLIFTFAAAVSCAASAAAPVAEIVSVTQAADRKVTVSYKLTGAPAVMTFSVLTNSAQDATGEWIAVGGESVTGGLDPRPAPEGDVLKRVEIGENRSFTWVPSRAISDAFCAGGMRIALTAWPLENTPPYMVANVLPSAAARVTYYPDEQSLPGGLLSNHLYRTGAIVMKKVPAKGVKWKYQNYTGSNYHVTMPNNYYMGVFEITQDQWRNVYGTLIAPNHGTLGYSMLPMESVSYRDIRESVGTATASGEADTDHMYPNPPHPDSFLGKLRTLTVCEAFPSGIDFDLPSEIEWEYVARSGWTSSSNGRSTSTGESRWNNGGWWMDADDLEGWSTMPGRNVKNRETTGWPRGGCPSEVGHYEPSSWGFYDMHGNIFEWCLDWYGAALYYTTSSPVMVNASGATLADGTTAGDLRTIRGGAYNFTTKTYYLPGNREVNVATDKWTPKNTPDARIPYVGLRVMCRAGLE